MENYNQCVGKQISRVYASYSYVFLGYANYDVNLKVHRHNLHTREISAS